MLTVNYVGKNKDTLFIRGFGFFIGENYFATCSSIYKPSDLKKLLSIRITYNNIWSDIIKFDTVSADLSYKPHGSQYNFSKIKFDSTDRRTDFYYTAINS